MLSIFRIFDLVIVVVLLEHHYRIAATVFFAIGIMSDVLDGFLARKSGAVTVYGKIIDPLADKILVIGTLIAMIKILNVPYWMVIVITAREFAVTGLRVIAASENIIIPANWWGKLKTTSQFVAIIVLMLGYYTLGVWLLGVAVLFTVVSGYIYFLNYFKAVEE